MALPLALFAAGAALKLGGSVYSAMQTRKDLKKQAMALDDQARLIEEQGQFEATQSNRQFENLLGEQKVGIATSGAEFEGSVLNILDQTLRDKEITQKNILDNAKRQANFLRDQARQVRKKRKNLLGMSILSTAGEIGQSYSSLDNAGKGTQPPPIAQPSK